jgi:tetratricopeptide (TPR) repeat protein
MNLLGLHRYPDSFVGRVQEISFICEVLSTAPILTISGGTGMGKTRIAHEAVRALGRELRLMDGESVSNVESLLALLLQAFELRADVATSEEAVLRLARASRHLSNKVLVLDGVAKLDPPVAVTLERFSSDLGAGRIIVTSRTPLGVRGEHVIRLGGLPEKDAVQLLTDRVERRGRTLGPSDARALSEIVERLDGIPLAIELFAPHVVMLGASNASTHFRETLPALRAGQHSLATSSSMDSALESSWSNLDEHAREVLSMLAVFPQSFDFHVAQAVCALVPTVDVGASLERLFHAGLIERVGSDRFVLMHCVREFARDRVSIAHRDVLLRCHAEVFAERARVALEALPRRGFPRDLELDKANYRVATETLRHVDGAIDDIAHIHVITEPLRYATSATSKGRDALDDFERELEARGASERVLLQVRLEAAEAARRAGDLDRAETRALTVYRALSSKEDPQATSIQAAALRALGAIAFVRGETSQARAQFEHAKECAEVSSENRVLALVFGDLGSVELVLGRPFEASVFYERSARLAARTGLTWVRAGALANLGVAAAELGELARARECLAQALSEDAAYAQSIVGAFATGTLGLISHVEGDECAASDAYHRALELSRALGHLGFVGVYTGYIALAEHRGEVLFKTLAALEDAISILERVDNRRERALFLAAQGTLLRRAERFESAAEKIARGRELLEENDHASQIAIALLSGESAPVNPQSSLELKLAARFLSRSTHVDERSMSWMISRDGSWFQTNEGERVEISGTSLRLVLSHLVNERLMFPGRSIPRGKLIEIAWPGERMSPQAARNRLKVNISKLRALGLRDLIRTGPAGYYLASNHAVQIA